MSITHAVTAWYALHVRSRHETIAATILRHKGYESFVPRYRSRRLWSDRIREIDLPVLPGYVFCRFQLNERQVPVITTPGVVRIVGVGNQPESLEEHEILALQRADRSGLVVGPWPYLKSGRIMRISHGSLSGLEGIYVTRKNSHRVIISVTLLQRSVAVEIDPAWLTPVVEKSSANRILVALPKQLQADKLRSQSQAAG